MERRVLRCAVIFHLCANHALAIVQNDGLYSLLSVSTIDLEACRTGIHCNHFMPEIGIGDTAMPDVNRLSSKNRLLS
jgi:hypothetical protein